MLYEVFEIFLGVYRSVNLANSKWYLADIANLAIFTVWDIAELAWIDFANLAKFMACGIATLPGFRQIKLTVASFHHV